MSVLPAAKLDLTQDISDRVLDSASRRLGLSDVYDPDLLLALDMASAAVASFLDWPDYSAEDPAEIGTYAGGLYAYRPVVTYAGAVVDISDLDFRLATGITLTDPGDFATLPVLDSVLRCDFNEGSVSFVQTGPSVPANGAITFAVAYESGPFSANPAKNVPVLGLRTYTVIPTLVPVTASVEGALVVLCINGYRRPDMTFGLMTTDVGMARIGRDDLSGVRAMLVPYKKRWAMA